MNNLGNSKQKGSKTAQLHLPTHDLFWANLRVQLHLPSLRSLDLLISPGTLTLAFESGYNYSLLLLCATDSLLVTETKQRSRTLRWLPTPNKDHALSAGYRNQTKITHSPLVTETKQRSRTLRWLPKSNKDRALSASFCVSTLYTNSKHWFTTSFLQEGAEKRCSERTLHTVTLMLRPWLYSSWSKPWMITQIITTH